jgi:hypothetical protein
MSTLPASRLQHLQRIQLSSLAVGALALAICVVGAFWDAAQFCRAYLYAYLMFLGIAHGCLVILMIYYLTGGAWGYLIRRILEAGMRTMPLLALLFIPVACGVFSLYLWAQPDAVAASKDLQHKAIYLNPLFFWGRAVLFFFLWVGTSYLLSRWSMAQDSSDDPRYGRWLSLLSGPGLVVFGITITFASIDWVMSLQPAFRSTIFGALFASGEVLSGMACALLVLAWILSRSPLAEVVSLQALNDLGNLLFTFLVVWAYMAFFQFMLIWIANLRYDIIWFLPRGRDGWQWVALAVFVLEFAVPFALLLSRDIKRDPQRLGRVAGLILVMHLVYQYWQVMPAFPGTYIGDHWMDFLTPVGVGGIWVAFFLRQLAAYPVLPRHDESQASASHLQELDREQALREQEVDHG